MREPIRIDAQDPRVGLVLSLADDELILGHRLSEWTGWVPYLEGDLAFSSIAQDELGHARALYRLLAEMGVATDEDALALGRAPKDYRQAAICARPNQDFANSLARHWLYDHADKIRLDSLRAGSWKELVEVLAVIELEEKFHRAHADAWFERLLNGPMEARRRFSDALVAQLPLVRGLFDEIEKEDALLADEVMTAGSAELAEQFFGQVLPILDEAGVAVDNPLHIEMVPTSSGAAEIEKDDAGAASNEICGRRGLHEPEFESLWNEMTALYRSETEAIW